MIGIKTQEHPDSTWSARARIGTKTVYGYGQNEEAAIKEVVESLDQEDIPKHEPMSEIMQQPGTTLIQRESNVSTGHGVYVNNSGAGRGVYANNSGTGRGVNVNISRVKWLDEVQRRRNRADRSRKALEE
jgi:hypothetical protein